MVRIEYDDLTDLFYDFNNWVIVRYAFTFGFRYPRWTSFPMSYEDLPDYIEMEIFEKKIEEFFNKYRNLL